MKLKKKIAALLAKISGSPEKRRLFENFLSLSVLQAAYYILPLITLPYLVRVLGPEKWGLVTFAQAFIQYFIVLTDYGFNLSATREISLHRENKQKTSEIFSAVIFIKLMFMITSLLLLTIMVFSVDKLRTEWLVYFLTFGMVVGNVLFPVWFFQGMERMKYITFLNVLFKLIFTVSIFIFVRETSDYFYVPLLNAIGFLTAGILGIRIVFKEFNIKLILPEKNEMWYHLKSGWHIFVSGVSINLSTVTNTVLLGFFTNDIIVGYYTAAERLYNAVSQLFNPAFQALYPYVVKLAYESTEQAKRLLNKTLFVILILTAFVWLILFSFAEPILNLVLSAVYKESIAIFKIFSPLFIIVPIAYILFNLAMLAFKLDRYFSRIYLIGGLLNVTLVCIFLIFTELAGRGVALTALVTQTLITSSAYITLFRNKVKLFPQWRL